MAKTIYRNEYGMLINWLKAERKKRGISQRDLALILEMDPAIIARIETCERRLDLIEFIEFCHAISCDPREGFTLVLTALSE